MAAKVMNQVLPNKLVDAHRVDSETFDYIYEENVVIPLQCQQGVVRANVYRPKGENLRSPVLVTYGPYGKDIHYEIFHPSSFADLPDKQKSAHSAWETPDPGYWTARNFAVVRADEVGLGQSPGFMDTMSASTSETFKDVIEWAAIQPWSTGKIGLLGVSYFAGTQWRVAARRPKGLACIIPWEGMSDYYRDRCRHGGILSNAFINFWWNRQVVNNQYGLPGRAARQWGQDTIEGDRTVEELEASRNDQTIDNERYRYYDEEYYASRAYDLSDIEVPVLSVGNWGGILLHLRGNTEGYMNAGSQQKWLRFITGRHDLPFYSPENVALQESFLEAFLKDNDSDGWTTGQVPRVGLVLRNGDVGYNNAEGEKAFPQRYENEWPIARTKYVKYYLTPTNGLTVDEPSIGAEPQSVSYRALGDIKSPSSVQFHTTPFVKETEFTGHFVAHLNVSVTPPDGEPRKREDLMDLDLFLTVRHISENRTEVLYTGTVGDPVPVTKGWLRTSLRKTNAKSTTWHPHRDYLSTDVAMLVPRQIYEVDVEIWPSNVVVQPGAKLVFEVSSGDTQGAGLFEHNSVVDRSTHIFAGMNHLHFGNGMSNWLLVPEIP